VWLNTMEGSQIKIKDYGEFGWDWFKHSWLQTYHRPKSSEHVLRRNVYLYIYTYNYRTANFVVFTLPWPTGYLFTNIHCLSCVLTYLSNTLPSFVCTYVHAYIMLLSAIDMHTTCTLKCLLHWKWSICGKTWCVSIGLGLKARCTFFSWVAWSYACQWCMLRFILGIARYCDAFIYMCYS